MRAMIQVSLGARMDVCNSNSARHYFFLLYTTSYYLQIPFQTHTRPPLRSTNTLECSTPAISGRTVLIARRAVSRG